MGVPAEDLSRLSSEVPYRRACAAGRGAGEDSDGSARVLHNSLRRGYVQGARNIFRSRAGTGHANHSGRGNGTAFGDRGGFSPGFSVGMACGARGDLFGLGRAATRVLFWRGAEEICGARGLSDGGRTSAGIPNELFGVAREFVPAWHNGEGKRVEVDRDCRVGGRASGRGENVPVSDIQ